MGCAAETTATTTREFMRLPRYSHPNIRCSIVQCLWHGFVRCSCQGPVALFSESACEGGLDQSPAVIKFEPGILSGQGLANVEQFGYSKQLRPQTLVECLSALCIQQNLQCFLPLDLRLGHAVVGSCWFQTSAV